MDNLYQEALKAHYSTPVGQNRSITTTHCSDGYNASCGDEISINLQINEDIINDIAFKGDSCAICTASASILCEVSRQKDLIAFQSIYRQLVAVLQSSDDFDKLSYQQLKILQPINQYPSRVNCALLPWQTAIEAISSPIKRDSTLNA